MAKIDNVMLIRLGGEEPRVVGAESDPGRFHVPLGQFTVRGDCALVLVLDDMTEIGISPESGGWRVATHRLGDPSVVDQLSRAWRV